MPENISLFEAIETQRAIRRFKPDPVSDELIVKLVEAATRAPSGANTQPWRFLVIREYSLKFKIADYYKKSWHEYTGKRTSHWIPSNRLTSKMKVFATHLANHIQEAPVIILVCIEHGGGPSTMSRGASIYPAVQNLLLAARGYGLGSVLTTLHKNYEDEIKGIFGIPENVETAALLPIGYPAEGSGYGMTRRMAPEEVIHWDMWNSIEVL